MAEIGAKCRPCDQLAAAVIGGGPVGLRTAIGMALMGAKVRKGHVAGKQPSGRLANGS